MLYYQSLMAYTQVAIADYSKYLFYLNFYIKKLILKWNEDLKFLA